MLSDEEFLRQFERLAKDLHRLVDLVLALQRQGGVHLLELLRAKAVTGERGVVDPRRVADGAVAHRIGHDLLQKRISDFLFRNRFSRHELLELFHILVRIKGKAMPFSAIPAGIARATPTRNGFSVRNL